MVCIVAKVTALTKGPQVLGPVVSGVVVQVGNGEYNAPQGVLGRLPIDFFTALAGVQAAFASTLTKTARPIQDPSSDLGPVGGVIGPIDGHVSC